MAETIGLEESQKWKEAAENLTLLVVSNILYLRTATTPTACTDDQFRRDHPAVVRAFGFLPANLRMDSTIMASTFNNIMNSWEWEGTSGGDYPLLGSKALQKPDEAIDGCT